MSNYTVLPYLKIAAKYIGIFLLLFVLYIGGYLLATWLLPKFEVKGEAVKNPKIPIYLSSNGIHADIVMPIKTSIIDWSDKLPFENTVSKNSAMEYVAIGWGDRGVYMEMPTWDDLTVSLAVRAAFMPSETVMHATYYKNMKVGENCVEFFLSEDQYRRLVNYVFTGFETNSNGNFKFIQTDGVYGKNDAFYKGTGSYTMFYTCNSWTNDGLKAAGTKAVKWTPFDDAMMDLYRD